MSQEPKVTRFGALPTVDAELATKAYVDSGGGAGLTFARVVKVADQIVNNSDTLVDDDELLFAANANRTYSFLLLILFASGTTPDWKIGWSVPAGASMEWGLMGGSAANSLTEAQTDNQNGNGAGTEREVAYSGRVVLAGTAGDVIMQWAQNVANASDTTTFLGSLLVVWESV